MRARGEVRLVVRTWTRRSEKDAKSEDAKSEDAAVDADAGG